MTTKGSPSSPQGFQVGPDTVVGLSYDLFDAEDDLVESSDIVGPLEVVFGYGQLASRVERAIEGKEVGDYVEVSLPPAEAYGHRDPEAIVELEASELPANVTEGDELEAENDAGDIVHIKILEVGGGGVVVDTNHPLAGQTVRFDLRIEEVRPATSHEIGEVTALLDRGNGAEAGSSPRLLPREHLIRGRRGSYESSGEAAPEVARPEIEPKLR